MPPRLVTSLATIASLSGFLVGCDTIVADTAIAYDDRFPDTVIDVYEPPRSNSLRPAVLVIHGGAWRADSDRGAMAASAERLARAGFVAFNVEYRRVPGGGEFPNGVKDCACALAFVRQHAARWAVDPERIAGYGYSAGGHLVAMLGVATDPYVQPDCDAAAKQPVAPLAAVISGAGVHDMAAMPEVWLVTELMQGTVDERPEAYALASPIHHAARALAPPPFLLLTGDQDVAVLASQSVRMRDTLESSGGDARLLVIPGGGHLLNHTGATTSWTTEGALDVPEAWSAAIAFLDETVAAR